MNNLGFWEKLHKPILCLAPMADVTDCVFRQIIAKYGKPDIFWTRFGFSEWIGPPESPRKAFIYFKKSKK